MLKESQAHAAREDRDESRKYEKSKKVDKKNADIRVYTKHFL